MERVLINFCEAHRGHSHEIIDALYAYYQSRDENYRSYIDFKMSSCHDKNSDLNVYLDYMPWAEPLVDDFDLVLYSNGCEPLIVSTPVIQEEISHKSNRYLACNSYLLSDHPLYHKIIWFPANIMVLRDLWCRHFTPFFFKNHDLRNHSRSQDIILINGRLDSWRHHLSNLVAESAPSIKQKSSIGRDINETKDCMFESPQDSLFRDQVNDLYEEVIVRNQETDYYTKMIQCGIDQKFGSWPMGYDILPEYFEYGCVIFPESTWINDEVAITEKILKCCFAGSLPWPVGGSNINKMYKDLGFYTAWNLLPEEHQRFDQEKDHMLRYQGLADATAWLSANKEVLVDDRAKEMLQSNLINMLTCSLDIQAVQKFNKLITQYLQK